MITTLIVAKLLLSFLGVVLMAKLIDGDEHFGDIGFGGVIQPSPDVFTRARATQLMAPTVRIGDVTDNRNLLSFIIEEIITWDVRHFEMHNSIVPRNAASEGLRQSIAGGITKDNTREVTAFPTADTIAQGTFPGGDQAHVASGAVTVGQEVPRFEERFQFLQFQNEENATGEINLNGGPELVLQDKVYAGYVVEGNWYHHLLTARNYHMWCTSSQTGNAGGVRLGAEVRKVVVDLKEVLFDRGSLITIEDAVGVISA